MIRRSAPIPSSEELHQRLLDLAALGFSSPTPTSPTTDVGLVLTWTGGWSPHRVYDHIGAPRGWQLVGDSDLVGRFRIGDERAKHAIICHRTLTKAHLAEIMVRHSVAAGHRYDPQLNGDDAAIFELLASFDEDENFPISKSVATHLLDMIQSVSNEEWTYEPSDRAHRAELQRLSSALGVIGYDTLWTKAYSELR